jgi:hypothetical protein
MMNAAMRFVVARVDDFSPEARRIVRSTALRVLVWLAVNGPGARDSSAALTELPGFSHSCHETTPQGISLTQAHPLRGEKCDGLTAARWSDGNGEHVKVLGSADALSDPETAGN